MGRSIGQLPADVTVSELLDRAAAAIEPMLTFGATEFPDARAVALAVLEAVRGSVAEVAAPTDGDVIDMLDDALSDV